MGIFNKNRKAETSKNIDIVEKLKPYVDYPIEKDRKKELLKALDKKIEEYTNENGILDFQEVLDELYDSCFEIKEINGVEYTFLVQVLSLYIYHVIITGAPIDLEKLL
ncbi:hypothetical protein [Methanothermococcus okinawensis]|uniref:Uncharacterized protein n=1 Tax=Methanothermococcus okinawensis (strain DSM 14208 / JCM 11175 / IH1) TaxID=647113 RepID=F8AKB8_METOI|nr:hypothetical protein [Methanothermococcus okinawensis]AEH06318.1 hypothetical protein Metok_0328 [Methanothermococcus okinawensis IH1]